MGADVAVQTLNLVACSPKPTLGDVCLRLCALGVLDAAQHCCPAMLNLATAHVRSNRDRSDIARHRQQPSR